MVVMNNSRTQLFQEITGLFAWNAVGRMPQGDVYA